MDIATGIYEHYKGQQYRVIGVARHSETEDVLVVYQTLYGARGLWVRPLTMFLETVEVEGVQQPRFKLVKEEKIPLAPI